MNQESPQKEKSIKAMVTDIDGSLTDDKRRISMDAIFALRELEKKEIPVMLASGNVLPIAYGLASFIGISGPVISENGGVVYHEGEVRYLADRKKCDIAFETLRKQLPVKKIFTDIWRKAEVAIYPDVDLEEVKKFVSDFNLKAETTGFAIHIFEPQVSKFQGLLFACDLLDIQVKDVVAFGDSENDIDMIKNCGIGLAPSNATTELKSHADFIASNPDGLGLVEGLRWLGLLD
ncbi:MAG: phosphoglycolate phosphatase [Thermoplasmata archaeon]|nr:MAG: phosphoglycolate phosphatase [Thermoplasmata archaeon]